MGLVLGFPELEYFQVRMDIGTGPGQAISAKRQGSTSSTCLISVSWLVKLYYPSRRVA